MPYGEACTYIGPTGPAEFNEWELQPPQTSNPLPFVDSLVVRGVSLSMGQDDAWLSGEVRLLSGGSWNTTAKNIIFNGSWFLSSDVLVPAFTAKQKQKIFARWSGDDNDPVRHFLRGSYPHHRTGPDFTFQTFASDADVMKQHRQSAPPMRGRHFTVTPTSPHEINMSNGWRLTRAKERYRRPGTKTVSSFPVWDFHPGKGRFNDSLTLSGVVLHGKSGAVWIEGHIRLLGGSAFDIGGGAWIWNGKLEVSRFAGTVAKDSSGDVVAVAPFDEKPMVGEVIACGRVGWGGTIRGPEFEFVVID